MSIYPGAVPPSGSAVASATLAAMGHTALHNDDRNEIRALATKLGTGVSTPTNNTVLRGDGAGSSSWGQVVLTTDVTNVLPIGNGGTGADTASGARTSLGVYSTSAVDSAISSAVSVAVAATKEALYPVGSIYSNASVSTNPGALLGFGTWTAFGAGRVLVGLNSADSAFDTVEEVGGAQTVDLSHQHYLGLGHDATTAYWQRDGSGNPIYGSRVNSGVSRGSTTYGATSGSSTVREAISETELSTTQSIMPPYIVVYMWKRTA